MKRLFSMLLASVMAISAITAAIPALSVGADVGNNWNLTSPDENISAAVSLSSAGSLQYSVSYKGETVIELSDMGIAGSAVDFSKGLTYSSISNREIHQSYKMYSGKADVYTDNSKETTIYFTKDIYTFGVVIRIANDSFSYRYTITTATPRNMSINAEKSTYVIPAGATAVSGDYQTYYESEFKVQDISQVSGDKGLTFLYQLPSGATVLLSEADMGTQFCGSSLNISNRVAKYNMRSSASFSTPFESPWRVAVIGDISAVAECQTFENLSDECAVADADDWVVANGSSWTWLTCRINNDPDVFKEYVDLSEEMGWGYMLMDDGWATYDSNQKIILPEWIDDLTSYANSKGIGMLAWLDNNKVNTEAKAESLFATLSAHGIKGVKIDFYNSESQDTMKEFDYIARITAKYHILVINHGANKPTGERRTYPHFLSREGVRGNEYDGGCNSFNNCLIALTRGVVGPTDYTPRFYSYDGKYTVNQSAGMALVVESGIPCLAGYPEQYRSNLLYSWYKDIPAAWDETKLLSAKIGDSVSMARRGNGAWYVSAICVSAQNASVNLSFLEAGKTYLAMIYKDVPGDVNGCTAEMRIVTRNDTITEAMSENGGLNIKITEQFTMPTDMILSHSEISVMAGTTKSISAKLTPDAADSSLPVINFVSADTSIAEVGSSGRNATITAKATGTTTITAIFDFNGTKIEKVCTVNVIGSDKFGTNLAIGATVSVDSSGSGFSAESINDGNAQTRWQSASSGANEENAAWAAYDFGKVVAINTLVLRWENAQAAVSGIAVQTSSNGTTWADVNATIYRDASNSLLDTVVIDPDLNTQYLRLRFTALAAKYTNPSLFEFEVYYVGERVLAEYNDGSSTAMLAFEGITAAEFGSDITVKSANGAVLDGSKSVGTGCVITKDGVDYTVILSGDVSGDGKIGTADFLMIRDAYLQKLTLDGAKLEAGLVSGGNTVRTADFLMIRDHYLKKTNIFA